MGAVGSECWPWSALGIAETSDKNAIRAAYDAKREALDGGGSISAFADLTAAREKALFFASELQREAGRSAEAEVDTSPPPADAPAEPEPEPEPEPAFDYVPGGRFADAADEFEDLPPGYSSRNDALHEDFWVSNGRAGDDPVTRFFSHFSFEKRAAWGILGLVFFLAFCSH